MIPVKELAGMRHIPDGHVPQKSGIVVSDACVHQKVLITSLCTREWTERSRGVLDIYLRRQ
jgi:hypothetical protein